MKQSVVIDVHTPLILLVCWYDPRGIVTVAQTIESIVGMSRHTVVELNLFVTSSLALPATLNLDAFAAVIIHNTVSYNVTNLQGLDRHTARKLRDYRGVKIMLKQDENFRFRELAEYLGATGFDVLFTCLREQDIPLIYPENRVGALAFEPMLTGYVTPSLRVLSLPLAPRTIDIGYRGSVQPLNFGRMAYEKRKIADDVQRLLNDSNAVLDISCQWEDRIGNTAWMEFLQRCRAVLGVESGGSVFDLDGNLAERCTKAEQELGPFRTDAAYAEAYLTYLKPLEDRVDYRQISPRHFEAAAAGTLQIMYPGYYSGIFHAGVHYFELARDGSNVMEALAFLRNEEARHTMTRRAYDDIIQNPDYWIEGFVARIDKAFEQCYASRSQRIFTGPPYFNRPHITSSWLRQQLWARLPRGLKRAVKPLLKRCISAYS